MGMVSASPAFAEEEPPPETSTSFLSEPLSEVVSGYNTLPDDVAELMAETVTEQVTQLEAEGAEILGATVAPYVPDDPGTGGVDPMAYPSGCGLAVLVYQAAGPNRIVGTSTTSCSTNWFSLTMSGTMTHYNP
ncbi:hypothetical protein QTO04_30185, partial [Vibrio parahaemolyticus]